MRVTVIDAWPDCHLRKLRALQTYRRSEAHACLSRPRRPGRATVAPRGWRIATGIYASPVVLFKPRRSVTPLLSQPGADRYSVGNIGTSMHRRRFLELAGGAAALPALPSFARAS